ncbi:histidinol-phosphate transaminase [Pseudomonadota bacterium]
MDKTNEKIIHLIRPEVQALQAYHVPPARGLIKLDAMENPYTWPAYLRGEWLEEMQGVTLNRYPDPESTELKARLRSVFKVPANMDIMLGNGSDELIQIINMSLKGRDAKVMAPEPSFSMYKMISAYVGIDYVGIPLNSDDFSLDMPATLAAIEEHQPAVIYLSYPNNPTGNVFAEEDVVQILEASDGLVVVDEAYTPFAGVSFMDKLGSHKNLLVMRTLSKMGLAGLRLGFLVGPNRWLSEFDKLRLPYNINALTQFTAEFALRYEDVFDEQTQQIVRDRAWVMESMSRLKGVETYPSDANFILFKVPAGQANRIHAHLQKKGVLIKNLSGASDMLRDCMRVTIGKPSENVAFLSALTSAL